MKFINLIVQVARLFISIYTNNKYINYIRLSYLHLILESKVKYKHSTRFLKSGSIYMYNFKSVAGIIKQIYNNC